MHRMPTVAVRRGRPRPTASCYHCTAVRSFSTAPISVTSIEASATLPVEQGYWGTTPTTTVSSSDEQLATVRRRRSSSQSSSPPSQQHGPSATDPVTRDHRRRYRWLSTVVAETASNSSSSTPTSSLINAKKDNGDTPQQPSSLSSSSSSSSSSPPQSNNSDSNVNKPPALTLAERFAAVSNTSSNNNNNNSSTTTTGLDSASTQILLQQTGLSRTTLQHLADQTPTPLKLVDMFRLGTKPEHRLQNAQFLHQELPVRIAQRAVDLLTLPHGLSAAAPIRQVAQIYLHFLYRLLHHPKPLTEEMEGYFTDMLQSFVLDRTSIPVSIAKGVHVWWNSNNNSNATTMTTTTTSSSSSDTTTAMDDDSLRAREMDQALYRFFTARVGLRFLTEHFVLSCPRAASTQALRHVTNMFPEDDETTGATHNENTGNNNNNTSTRGCIQPNCDVGHELRRVADLVREQTRDYYGGVCPVMELVECEQPHNSHGKTKGSAFTHVPHHLHYIVSELLKNSCRASVRRYRDEGLAEVPPIRVVVVKGKEDVTIKIADRGGGIPRSLMATIWKFAHSTASEDELQAEFGTDVSGARIRGFGLPLARIYARYFGGELTLKSTEGYGLDAYLHLPRLGNCCENLPLKVSGSPGNRKSLP